MIDPVLPQKILSVLAFVALACLQWGCAGAPKFTYSMQKARIIETLGAARGKSQEENLNLYLAYRVTRRKKIPYVGLHALTHRGLGRYLKNDHASFPDPARDAEYLAILGNNDTQSFLKRAWPELVESDKALQAFNRSLQRRLGLPLSDLDSKPDYPNPASTFSAYRAAGLEAPQIREFRTGWQVGDRIYDRVEIYDHARKLGHPELVDKLAKASRYKFLSQIATGMGGLVLVPSIVGGVLFAYLSRAFSYYYSSGKDYTREAIIWGGIVSGSGALTGLGIYGWTTNFVSEKRIVEKLSELSIDSPDGRSSIEQDRFIVDLALEPLPGGMNLRLATRF